MNSPKALMNWSGGKDAAFSLYQVMENGTYQVETLFTTVNRHHRRISQHGVRVELLKMQAESLGLPLHIAWMPRYPSMETYNALMKENLLPFKERQITSAIFGDILLEDLRAYREQQLASLGFTGVFPLWQRSTDELVHEFISAGFKAVVVCINDQHLDKRFVGREINEAFLEDLPDTVDPCGENGEFHSFVYDGPFFHHPVSFTKGELVHRRYEPPKDEDSSDYSCGSDDADLQQTGFWYCDLLPVA